MPGQQEVNYDDDPRGHSPAPFRALFVDDDPNVLGGLQRILRKEPLIRSSAFVDSGPQALERLGADPFDVVVVDARMPEMSGVELLQRVRHEHPRVVRIMLSGQTDWHTALDAMGLANRYLSKPCAPELLVASLRKAVRWCGLVEHEGLKGFLGRISTLPCDPRLFRIVRGELEATNPSLDTVSEAIGRDMGMAAKLLQVVNSGIFGATHSGTDIREETGRLGVDLLRSLVASDEGFQPTDRWAETAALQHLRVRSVTTAALARDMAVRSGLPASDAFAGGLLLDVGAVVSELLGADGRVPQADGVGHRATDATWESDPPNSTIAEMGGYLLGLWGFPDPIVGAVAFSRPRADAGELEARLVTIVQRAKSVLDEQLMSVGDGVVGGAGCN